RPVCARPVTTTKPRRPWPTRNAAELAMPAGLPSSAWSPTLRSTRSATLDAISDHEAVADPSAPSAAAMAPTALEGAARLLADLNLTAQRPFRVIDDEGVPRRAERRRLRQPRGAP